MTAAQFESYATGKTMIYAQGGTVWGSEQYLSGHRVMWAFTGQKCEYGQWYEDKGAICFIYEGTEEPNCWHFYQGKAGLVAQYVGGVNSTLLSEVGQSPKPLVCPGPEIGA